MESRLCVQAYWLHMPLPPAFPELSMLMFTQKIGMFRTTPKGCFIG